jgi:hypothetical protein
MYKDRGGYSYRKYTLRPCPVKKGGGDEMAEEKRLSEMKKNRLKSKGK